MKIVYSAPIKSGIAIELKERVEKNKTSLSINGIDFKIKQIQHIFGFVGDFKATYLLIEQNSNYFPKEGDLVCFK